MPKKAKSKTSDTEKPQEEGTALPQRFLLKALALRNGYCPVEDWVSNIRDNRTLQRIQARLFRIERGNLGDFRPVGEGVFEFRLDFGPGYRIYYAHVGTTIIVLLVGGDKSTQSSDITLARNLWKDNKDDPERYQRDIRR